MKLVNTKTGFVVVEFEKGKARFYDRFLEAELKDRGIFIPLPNVSEFGGKSVIFPEDLLFEKAFFEIYVPFSIANPTYQWEKS